MTTKEEILDFFDEIIFVEIADLIVEDKFPM